VDHVREQWAAAWPAALAAWSKFTRLRPPNLCLTETQARHEGLTGSFAMIRLQDQAVVVSLPEVIACHVESFATEVLAHEIGHHVPAPATLTDHMRMIARMRWALPTVEQHAPMVANLYTDVLINDRLQRSAGLRVGDVYRAIGKGGSSGAVWTLYLRIYEILWSLERGSLGGGQTDDRLEGDAWLGARLARSYARATGWTVRGDSPRSCCRIFSRTPGHRPSFRNSSTPATPRRAANLPVWSKKKPANGKAPCIPRWIRLSRSRQKKKVPNRKSSSARRPGHSKPILRRGVRRASRFSSAKSCARPDSTFPTMTPPFVITANAPGPT